MELIIEKALSVRGRGTVVVVHPAYAGSHTPIPTPGWFIYTDTHSKDCPVRVSAVESVQNLFDGGHTGVFGLVVGDRAQPDDFTPGNSIRPDISGDLDQADRDDLEQLEMGR